MDNLPKPPSNDLSGFSGVYPEPQAAPPPPPPMMQTVAEPLPSPNEYPTYPMDNTGAPPPPPPGENPFIMQVDQPPVKNGNGLKRILGFFILILVLVGIGFFAFKFLGKFLSGNQPTTLTYWGLWENEAVLKPLVDEYKKTHPKIEIAYSKQSPKQYRERLQAAIQRGDGPDIFRFHNTWVPMLKNELAAAGTTGYTTSEFQQTFYPVAGKDLVIAGKVYGAPLMIEGLGLFYNEDLLRAAGVQPPTSWEAFQKATLTLVVRDGTGKIITAGAALGTTGNVEHYSDIIALLMLQNGADLKNPTSLEAQTALSFYRSFAEKPNQVWDETLDNSILAFANGRVAMIFAPSWEVFNIREINANLKFQVLPVPQLSGTNTTWASYWVEGVSSKSKHPDEAWEFLKFLTTKDSEVKLYTEITKLKERPFGEPYSRVDLSSTIANDPFAGAFIRQAPNAQTFFLASRTFDNGINDDMIKYLENAVNSLGKGVSVQAALDTMAKGFNQVLGRYGFSSTAK